MINKLKYGGFFAEYQEVFRERGNMIIIKYVPENELSNMLSLYTT